MWRLVLLLSVLGLAGCTVQEALDRTVNRPVRHEVKTPPPLPQKIVKQHAPVPKPVLDSLFAQAKLIIDTTCARAEDLPGWPKVKKTKDTTTTFTRRRLRFRVRRVHRGTLRESQFTLVDADFQVVCADKTEEYFYQVLTRKKLEAGTEPLYRYAFFFREDDITCPDAVAIRVPVKRPAATKPPPKPPPKTPPTPKPGAQKDAPSFDLDFAPREVEPKQEKKP